MLSSGTSRVLAVPCSPRCRRRHSPARPARRLPSAAPCGRAQPCFCGVLVSPRLYRVPWLVVLAMVTCIWATARKPKAIYQL